MKLTICTQHLLDAPVPIGAGPAYQGDWDQLKGASTPRILAFCDQVLLTTSSLDAPSPETEDAGSAATTPISHPSAALPSTLDPYGEEPGHPVSRPDGLRMESLSPERTNQGIAARRKEPREAISGPAPQHPR